MFYASFPCGVPIPFWVLFLISDNPGGRNLQISMTSGGQNMKSEHQKTYDLIPHMTHFHGFHILTYRGHWYLEVKTTIWSSEVKKGLRMESENQKAYDLIPHVTHLQWFHILTFLEVVIEGRSNWRSYICVNISTWSKG